MLVDPEMSEYLMDSLTSVRTVSVKVRKISMEELAVSTVRRKEVRAIPGFNPETFTGVIAAGVLMGEGGT